MRLAIAAAVLTLAVGCVSYPTLEEQYLEGGELCDVWPLYADYSVDLCIAEAISLIRRMHVFSYSGVERVRRPRVECSELFAPKTEGFTRCFHDRLGRPPMRLGEAMSGFGNVLTQTAEGARAAQPPPGPVTCDTIPTGGGGSHTTCRQW